MNRPQSLAGVKLSGCKNATPAQRRGPHTVWLPKWGVQVETAAEVPEASNAWACARFTCNEPTARGATASACASTA